MELHISPWEQVMTDVERTVQIEAAPDEVWDALTDAALLREWFDGDVDVDLRPGGALRVTTGDDVRRAVVDEVDAPHRLAFTWSDDDRGPASTVELELEPTDAGCVLHVREVLLDTVAEPAFPSRAEGGAARMGGGAVSAREIGFQAPHRHGEALALARS